MYIQALRLQGDHYDMGNEQGERFHKPIQKLVQTRLHELAQSCAASSASTDTLHEIARRVWDQQETYDPLVTRELLGIADGAEMDPLDLLLAIGDADVGDLAGCAAGMECSLSLWLNPTANRHQFALLGYTLALPIEQGYPVIALHHVPDEGPDALLLTTHSGLGLAGLNAAGLAAAINQVHVTDARPGVISAFLLRHALEHGSLEGAAKALIAAPRMAGCNILLADSWGRALNIELSGKEASVTLLQSRSFVHTNHFHSRTLQAMATPPRLDSTSIQRQRRMKDLIQATEGELNIAMLQSLLGDHQPSEAPICMHDETGHGIHTCGSAIISPSERTMLVAAGPACQAEYITLQL